MLRRNKKSKFGLEFENGYYNGIYDLAWEITYFIEEKGITDVKELEKVIDRRADELVAQNTRWDNREVKE